MPRIAPLFSVLLIVGVCASAQAWQPVGNLRELYDPALLPLLRPGVKSASFSSYDRSGGNNDGFSGTYSKLREENGDSVLAEMQGPGILQRIWFTHSEGKPDGLLERKGEHIRIYVDSEEKAALDLPLEALFDNSLERFPNPLAGQGIGGFYSYVPIPYAKSCKVVVDGLGVRFYQINYCTLPSADGVKPFAMELDKEEKADLDRAVQRWRDPLSVTHGNGITARAAAAEEGDCAVLLDGPQLVVGVTFEGTLGDGVMEIQGNGAQLRLPLMMYFGTTFGAKAYTSAFIGQRDSLHYNLFPFYASGETRCVVHPAANTRGTLTVFSLPVDEVPAAAARLGAQYNESLPTAPDVPHPFLKLKGRGHYVGTYLVTEGPKGLPFWLEGDDIWTIDDEMRIHGTGSEDYFNCGWYALEGRLNGPGGFPSHGFPVYGIEDDRMRAVAYRWHLADPVPFDSALQAEIEHGEVNKFVADYRSVAWYYAE